jgi:hypothetical protein
MDTPADFPIGRRFPPVWPDERLIVAIPVAEQVELRPYGLNPTHENAPLVLCAYPNGHALFEIVGPADFEILDEHQLSGMEVRLHGPIGHRYETEGALEEWHGEILSARVVLFRFAGRLEVGEHVGWKWASMGEGGC